MKKIAILVDLELNEVAGGHVKFWERVCHSLGKNYKEFNLSVFFLGENFTKKRVGKNIIFYTLKPIISSGILKPLGVDADKTDLCPINLRLFLMLREFDIIHSTDQLFCMAKTAIYASNFWRIPLTTSLHTDTPSYTEYYVKNIFKRSTKLFYKIFIKKLKLHKVLSKKQKKKQISYIKSCAYAMIDHGIQIRKMDFTKDIMLKICKISRGVDSSIFKQKKINRKELLERYKLPKNKKIIFFCGRVHELKGAVFLSKIHKLLIEKNIEVISVFAGEDIHGEKCLSIGGENIKLLGHLNENEISDLYNLCDLFVFPSRYETGPQVVLEAKACGAVSVVSPEGGGKRIKKNGIDGVVIKEFNVTKWTEVIISLLNNKKKINFMKKQIILKFTPPSWNKIFYSNFSNKWRQLSR